MQRTGWASPSFIVLCLVVLGACGDPAPLTPPTAQRRVLAAPTATPDPIPACKTAFKQVGHLADAEMERTGLSAASKSVAFFSGRSRSGRIWSDGTIEEITFPAGPNHGAVSAHAISEETAWFLRGDEPWFYDGHRASPAPVPEGIDVASLGVGGGEVWAGGKEGDSPAILHRANDQWERVPIQAERFEHLGLTVGDDGTPYVGVTQAVPKPPAPPGTIQTLELQTKTSIWTWDGSEWIDITPEGFFHGIEPGRAGELYAIGPDLEARRFYGGGWVPITVASTAFPEAENAKPGTIWRPIFLVSDVDASGRLWLPAVLTMGSLETSGQFPALWLLDGDAIRRVPLPPEMQGDLLEVSTVTAAPDGAIWVTTGTRVFLAGCK